MHHQQQYRTTLHCSSETRVKLYGILLLGGTGQHEKLNPFDPEVVDWHLTMLPQWWQFPSRPVQRRLTVGHRPATSPELLEPAFLLWFALENLKALRLQ